MSGPCTDCGGPDYQTLLARIAELEDQLSDITIELLRKKQTELAENGGCPCCLAGDEEGHILGCELGEAEAALEERDRMLRWLWEHTPKVNYSYEQWLADLRTRASAAPESGFECNDICESCEWYAPGTDQGLCTTDDPREQPDNCPRAEEGSAS